MSLPNRPPASRRLTQPKSPYLESGRQSEQAERSTTNSQAQLSVPSSQPRPQDGKSRSLSRQTSNEETPQHSPPTTLHRPTLSNASDQWSRDGSMGSPYNTFTGDMSPAEIALGQGLLPPPHIPALRSSSRPYSMRHASSSTSLSRVATPRSVRDLGRDFDRYYNPFATPSHSTTDLTALLPRRGSIDSSRYEGGVSGLTTRRNSNPFADEHQPLNQSASSPAMASMASPGNEYVDEHDANMPFFPYLDDRLGAPVTEDQGYTFPLYWHEKEWDDDMHLPMVDDDIKLKPTLRDRFSKEHAGYARSCAYDNRSPQRIHHVARTQLVGYQHYRV